MYAIVDIAGQQFKVEKGQELFVHRLEGEKGDHVDFEKVMLIDHEGKTVVGTPVIEGASVKATILEHLKGDKVLVFKKKRRKGFKKFNGHRQYLSLLKIEDILEKAPKTRSKKAAAPAAEVEAAPEEAPEQQ
ncbi:MAG: 50S ribosomal protein L21 [Bacteroidales bacterium]|nr:50S ribosomal protein L21 [Bacteroidales bacterium]